MPRKRVAIGENMFRLDIGRILAAVPGDTEAEKARAIGVSRQLVNLWARKKARPGWKHSLRLAKVTGLPAPDIAGVWRETRT